VIGKTALERVLLWLAFSGGAILAERSTAEAMADPPPGRSAEFQEDKED
jgi:hypothetical protein